MLQNKKNINLIFGHCCCFNHPIHLVSTIIEMQQHLNKVNNRIHVKITCRVFDPSLNNKTTVTYVMMQTTQTDSFFKIIDSLIKYMGVWIPVILIQSHFDTNSSSEILQKSLITSKKVCFWTRKTFWVFHSLSQVCETIYQYIHRLKLFDNWINCNCCCCWYTSKERNCIETTCIWKDFVSKQPVTIGVCLPRDDAKEKISRPF